MGQSHRIEVNVIGAVVASPPFPKPKGVFKLFFVAHAPRNYVLFSLFGRNTNLWNLGAKGRGAAEGEEEKKKRLQPFIFAFFFCFVFCLFFLSLLIIIIYFVFLSKGTILVDLLDSSLRTAEPLKRGGVGRVGQKRSPQMVECLACCGASELSFTEKSRFGADGMLNYNSHLVKYTFN